MIRPPGAGVDGGLELVVVVVVAVLVAGSPSTGARAEEGLTGGDAGAEERRVGEGLDVAIVEDATSRTLATRSVMTLATTAWASRRGDEGAGGGERGGVCGLVASEGEGAEREKHAGVKGTRRDPAERPGEQAGLEDPDEGDRPPGETGGEVGVAGRSEVEDEREISAQMAKAMASVVTTIRKRRAHSNLTTRFFSWSRSR